MKKTPLKPGKKGLKRTGFKRKLGSLDAALEKYHGFKPRKKAMGEGKKRKAHRAAMKAAIDGYFQEHGWEDGTKAFDQVTGLVIDRLDAIAHHKKPASELRKEGVKDIDAPHRLIICHWAVHKTWVHKECPGGMGRPEYKEWFEASEDRAVMQALNAHRRFGIIESSPANATNNLCVDWSEQDRDDMNRFLGVNTNA